MDEIRSGGHLLARREAGEYFVLLCDGSGGAGEVVDAGIGEGVARAKGHYDLIHGRISSSWKLDGKSFHWEISVPPNTIATVHVPGSDKSNVTNDGKPVDDVEGVKFLRMENNRAVVEVVAGRFHITPEL